MDTGENEPRKDPEKGYQLNVTVGDTPISQEIVLAASFVTGCTSRAASWCRRAALRSGNGFEDEKRWTFLGSVFFVNSLVTTIGSSLKVDPAFFCLRYIFLLATRPLQSHLSEASRNINIFVGTTAVF